MKDILERDPPNGARITFNVDSSLDGWHAPDLQPWLTEAVERGANEHFTYGLFETAIVHFHKMMHAMLGDIQEAGVPSSTSRR